MIEYLNNIYVVSFIATLISLIIVYIYDKFEKKQYTTAIYFRISILLYVSIFIALYLSRYINLLSSDSIQIGGSDVNSVSQHNQHSQYHHSDNTGSKFNIEPFKTGISPF